MVLSTVTHQQKEKSSTMHLLQNGSDDQIQETGRTKYILHTILLRCSV